MSKAGFSQSGVLSVLKNKMVGMKDDLDKVKEELEQKTQHFEEERGSREKVRPPCNGCCYLLPLLAHPKIINRDNVSNIVKLCFYLKISNIYPSIISVFLCTNFIVSFILLNRQVGPCTERLRV